MLRALFLSIVFLNLSACGDIAESEKIDSAATKTNKTSETNTSFSQSSILTLIRPVSDKSFGNLKNATAKLDNAIKRFIENRTPESLIEARESWHQTHNTYIATRLFRQWVLNLNIQHPELDVAQTAPELIHTLQSRIDQHPILPGYLDKVAGYPFSGLINSDIELTPETLNEEHQLGDKAYVTLGFHALEFMLFGEQSHGREIDDFRVNATQSEEEQAASLRRVKYIKVLSSTLKKDIEQLSDAWSGPEAFYPSALSLIPQDELSNAIKQISEVELEACKQIDLIIKEQPDKQIHDTTESIKLRTNLAKEILEIVLKNNSA